MATILEVEDERDGGRKALKLMLPGMRGDESTRRFRSEHRALSRLSHPNVLRAFEGGLFDGRPYFTMELLEGRELRDEVQQWRELPPAERFRRAEQVLVQIARALEYIHARGFVHRDVTPSNIFLLPDGSARLMDFGVVKEPGEEITGVGEVLGTVAYMAPEQLSGGRVDARADLYSLGAVTYLMLTGRRPFNARTLAGYVEKHLHRPVRPVSAIAPTVPRKLDEVCLRLLAKDPADRFASATHLLHVLEADAPSEPVVDPARPGWIPALEGRAAELATLQSALARLSQGRGAVLLLEGGVGQGKSRLADEAVELARRNGAAVLLARNAARDQQPFAGFRELFRALTDHAPRESRPVLEAAFVVATPGAAPLEWRAVGAAFKDLIPTDRPLLLVIEDIDRADRGTQELLAYLLRALLGIASAPVLFLTTLTERAGLEPDLRAALEGDGGITVHHLALGPLGQHAVEAMLLSLVVDTPAARALAIRLHREGEGNPYFITEMLRGLIEQGILVLGRGGRGTLTLDEAAVARSSLPVPGTLREAILERLRGLGPEAIRVSAVLAAARGEATLDLVMSASDFDEERALSALDELVDAGLVRERRVGRAETFELSHHRLGDVISEETPASERARYHRRIGEVLERINRRHILTVVESLAYHFDQGDAAAKAYPYLVQSAEKLMSRGFVTEALETLDRALVAEHSAREYLTLEDADRQLVRVLLRRASALFLMGRWAEANADAQSADDLARQITDPALTSASAAELGIQARRRQDLAEADVQLRRALADAHQAGSRSLITQPMYEFGALQWTRGDLEAARGCWLEVLANARACADDRSVAIGYNGLGLLALCRGQVSEARDHLEQAAALCERLGLIDRLVVCNLNLVELTTFTGHFRKALAIADRSLAQAREMNHQLGISLGLFCRALVLTDLGRMAEATEHGDEALQILERLGDPEDELPTRILLARLALERGDHASALATLDVCVELAQRYDAEGFLPLAHAWRCCALVAADRAPEAREALELALTTPARPWPYQQTRLALSLSRAARLLGDRDIAIAQAERALEIAERCGFRYYVLLARIFLLRVLRGDAEAGRHEKAARALALSLAGGLERDDGLRLLAQLGIAGPICLEEPIE